MTGNGVAAASWSRPQPATTAATTNSAAAIDFSLTGVPVVQQSGEGLGDAVQRLVHVSDLSVEWMDESKTGAYRCKT